MITIAIVNYGLCNLDSVARAVQECGATPLVTKSADDIAKADKIILPGVGAFRHAMDNLREAAMDEALTSAVVDKGTDFLGICLGMQLIATHGYEGEGADGLDWIPGEICPLRSTIGERIPHMGWNEVAATRDCPLFNTVKPGSDFYFVHGFHFVCKDEADVAARTPYCDSFVSAVARGNIYGVQFHPEKSQRIGFNVLTNFIGL